MILVSAGSLSAGSRVTMTLLPATELGTMSWVRRSKVSFVSVIRRPKEDADVTRRGWPAGSGMLHTYGVCVWPLMIMSICGDSCCAIGMIGLAGPLRPVLVPVGHAESNLFSRPLRWAVLAVRVGTPPWWIRTTIALTPCASSWGTRALAV